MFDSRIDYLPVLSKASVDARRMAPRGKASGILISEPIDFDRPVDRETVRCCHCGRIWQWHSGSGRMRSFCGQCAMWTCGPLCPIGDQCIPYEKVIELMEKGYLWHEIPYSNLPVSVSVPAEVPKKIILGG